MRLSLTLGGLALLASCAPWPPAPHPYAQANSWPDTEPAISAAALTTEPAAPVKVHVPMPTVPAVPRTRGSLYAEQDFQAVTSDRRSHRVGDLVSVIIYENASASSTADTGANRDGGAGINIVNPVSTKGFGVSTNNDFTAGGRTQRAGKVLGQLTVSVRAVAPNGDLQVAGEQQLDINGERQTIRLEGRVRPRDISELNTVLSTRVADAKISFAGDGVLGDRQRPAWWHQVLTFIGL